MFIVSVCNRVDINESTVEDRVNNSEDPRRTTYGDCSCVCFVTKEDDVACVCNSLCVAILNGIVQNSGSVSGCYVVVSYGNKSVIGREGQSTVGGRCLTLVHYNCTYGPTSAVDFECTVIISDFYFCCSDNEARVLFNFLFFISRDGACLELQYVNGCVHIVDSGSVANCEVTGNLSAYRDCKGASTAEGEVTHVIYDLSVENLYSISC